LFNHDIYMLVTVMKFDNTKSDKDIDYRNEYYVRTSLFPQVCGVDITYADVVVIVLSHFTSTFTFTHSLD